MASKFTISTIFNGIDNLSAVTKKIVTNFGKVSRAAGITNRSILKVGSSAKRMGQNLRGASIAGAVGLTAILAPAIAFSDQINELEAVSMATANQMANMTAQAKKLGSTTRFSASQAASAQTFLARAGFKTNEILAATPDVLNLAAASNMELARTADIASNIMGAFKIQASDMARVADVLAATTSSSNVTLEQLAQSLEFAGPVAKAAGLSLEETAAAIGLLGNVGIQGSKAGTGLTRMLTSLAAPSKEAAKFLKILQVQTLQADGSLRKFPNILKDVSKGLDKLPSGARLKAIKSIFGLEGIAGASEIIDQAGGAGLEKLAAGLTNVTGRSKQMADIMNKGPGGAIRRLKSAAEGLALAMGDSGLTAKFTKIVNKITDFVSQMSNAEQSTLGNVTIMIAFAAALAPVLLTISAMITVIAPLAAAFVFMGGIIGTVLMPLLSPLIGLLTTLYFRLVSFALLNPLGLIVVGVVAVIAVFALLIIFWDDIVDAFSSGIDMIMGFLQPLIDIISTVGDIGSLFAKVIFGTETEDADKPKPQTAIKGLGIAPVISTETEQTKIKKVDVLGNLGDVGGLVNDAFKGPELPPTAQTENETAQGLPAQFANNQVSTQANALARVEFTGTPDSGVQITDDTGEQFDPTLGLTAAAGI